MNTGSFASPLGAITLASHGGKLIGLWFDGQKYDRVGLFEAPCLDEDEAIIKKAKQWLEDYFNQKAPQPFADIAPNGTDFQKKVWQALLTIPYGETRSYAEIADIISCRSARAVGTAIGKNPISIIIPCHRVLGASGALTGYAGGVARKQALLSLENK